MRNRHDSRPAARITTCLLLIAASSLAAHALPPGYKDDFNGCATQSADDADRKRCCIETFKQCSNECGESGAGGTEESLACRMSCLEAQLKCEDGRVVTIVAWPGDPAAEVPGLTSKGDHLLPGPGYEIAPSRIAVLVEVRGQGELADDACVAFVVACQCPPGTARGQECRARMEGKGTACQICKSGSSAESCKPCADCRSELLSAQPCAASELPASKKK